MSSVTPSAVSSGAGVLGKPSQTQQLASFPKKEAHRPQPTHKAESPRVLKSWFLFGEQARSLQWEGWSQASVGNWIPWDLDP